jgi:TPR repeat protein
MDEGLVDELSQLQLDVGRRKDELEKLPGHVDCDEMTLKRRRSLQRELEVATLRMAELAEMQRIETLKQSAIDSGLILSPVDMHKSAECPLCFEKLRIVVDSTSMLCCGATFCDRCTTDIHNRQDIASRKVYETFDLIQRQQAEAELAILNRCPFCRTRNGNDAHKAVLLSRNAHEGKAWAQLVLGQCLMDGILDMPQDRVKAAEWYRLAADQGSASAMNLLSRWWENGCAEAGIEPSIEKMFDYMMQAARNGSPIAQDSMTQVSTKGGDKDAFVWCSLSAAQGYFGGQCRLGEMHLNGQFGLPRCVYTALYWFRSAALQGDSKAQLHLAQTLVQAKMEMYDGIADIAGHSAIPEARFWFDKYETAMISALHSPIARPEFLQIIKCAVCEKSETDCRIRRCARCKSVGYCDRTCQAKHWDMGHQMDCKNMKVWQDAMKNVESYP